MKSILTKLTAIVESLTVAVVSFFTGQPAPSPTALPEPPAIVQAAPSATSTPITSILAISTVSPAPVAEATPEPTPIVTPTPSPTPSLPPQFEEIIVQLEEVKREIAEYERTVVTPIPTPTMTPTPTPSYLPIPQSVEEFAMSFDLSKIDACKAKYPKSVLYYAERKLAVMEGRSVQEVQGKEAADAENLGNYSDAEHVALWEDYWKCVGELLSVSSFVQFADYGRRADDATLATFQRLLVEYVK